MQQIQAQDDLFHVKCLIINYYEFKHEIFGCSLQNT